MAGDRMTARRRWVPRILLLAIVVALGFGYTASLNTTPDIAVVDTPTYIEGN